ATHWQDLPRAEDIQMDSTVLIFAIVIVFVSALVAGLVPAISSTGKHLLSALQESARSLGGGVSPAALRKAPLAAGVALPLGSADLGWAFVQELHASALGGPGLHHGPCAYPPLWTSRPRLQHPRESCGLP